MDIYINPSTPVVLPLEAAKTEQSDLEKVNFRKKNNFFEIQLYLDLFQDTITGLQYSAYSKKKIAKTYELE